MSDMKCPVCNKQMKIGMLDPDDSMGTVWMSIMPCDCVCSYGASKAVWQELIRTKELLEVESSEHELCHDAMVKRTEEVNRIRKALDVAADALKWIHETYNLGMGYEAAIMEKCESALEQITTLEQKDVK